MSTFLTAAQLRQLRAMHMNNLNHLSSARPQWDAKTTLRGEATIANLVEQIYDIDAELQMAKQPVQAWSAA
mgnify:CR=1 FL=1